MTMHVMNIMDVTGHSTTSWDPDAPAEVEAARDVLRGHNDEVTHRLCAHAPSGSVPQGDQLLAQKIMLELAEDDFLRIANRHSAR